MDTQSMKIMCLPELNDPITKSRCRLHKEVEEEEVHERQEFNVAASTIDENVVRKSSEEEKDSRVWNKHADLHVPSSLDEQDLIIRTHTEAQREEVISTSFNEDGGRKDDVDIAECRDESENCFDIE